LSKQMLLTWSWCIIMFLWEFSVMQSFYA
jgi:hypothetical protein